MTAAEHARSELSARLYRALDAITAGDDGKLRHEIESIAGWQERALLEGLARLSRELGTALGSLPALDATAAELPDAVARLDHVVELTEKATMRTLDLVEDCQQRLDSLDAGNADELAVLRANLKEMALAQSFQDLTGQIIRRVVQMVHRVHDQLGAMGFPPRAPAVAAVKGHGPAVPGRDLPGVSQDDADDLLAGLGL